MNDVRTQTHGWCWWDVSLPHVYLSVINQIISAETLRRQRSSKIWFASGWRWIWRIFLPHYQERGAGRWLFVWSRMWRVLTVTLRNCSSANTGLQTAHSVWAAYIHTHRWLFILKGLTLSQHIGLRTHFCENNKVQTASWITVTYTSLSSQSHDRDISVLLLPDERSARLELCLFIT